MHTYNNPVSDVSSAVKCLWFFGVCVCVKIFFKNVFFISSRPRLLLSHYYLYKKEKSYELIILRTAREKQVGGAKYEFPGSLRAWLC